MSNSRKKISCDQIPLLSVTQKLRQNLMQTQHKRKCYQKENHNQSKQRRQSKGKQANSSSKKLKKKKFLEQQLEKILQKRQLNEQAKLKQMSSNNVFQFEGLRGELKQMKDTLSKLACEQKKPAKQDKVHDETDNKEQFEIACSSYQRKIDDLRAQLQVQKLTNAKLQEAHIQSQLFAKQTKDYCQSINKQLAQLAQKHITCESTAKQLKENRQKLQLISIQKEQMNVKIKMTQGQRQLIKESLKIKTEQCNQMKKTFEQMTNVYEKTKESEQFYKQQIKKLQNQKVCLLEKQKKLSNYLKQKEGELQQKQVNLRSQKEKFEDLAKAQARYDQKLKQLNLVNLSHLQTISEIQKSSTTMANQLKKADQNLAAQKQKVVELTAKNELLIDLKAKAQSQLKKLQTQFNNTKLDLGNTKQKLCSLSSMQKKCEELYVEIKLQKQRCTSFSIETIKERENLQNRLARLEQEKKNYLYKIQAVQSQNLVLKPALEEAKLEAKKSLDEKNKISKQFEQLQEQLATLTMNKIEIMKQNQVILNKIVILKSQFNQKQKVWAAQRQRCENKQQYLEKQKNQIEMQVKGTLEAFKKRNDQIQQLNQDYQHQINKLKEQKLYSVAQLKTIEANLRNATVQNQKIKHTISIKEKIIRELENNISQVQFQLSQNHDKIAQLQLNHKNIYSQCQNRLQELKAELAQIQKEKKQLKINNEQQIKQWKQKCQKLQEQLQENTGKILNLSEIRQNLQMKLQDIEQRLHQTQTIRLSLSSQLIQHQQTTRRNEQQLQEEKRLLQGELKLKNKTINELKETVKLVRDQSMQIRQEVSEYNKVLDLQQLVGSQVKKIQQKLNFLSSQKKQLQLAVNILKSQNNELSNKIFTIENQGLQWPEKETRYSETINHLQEQLQILYEQKDKVSQELENQKSAVTKLSLLIQDQKKNNSKKLIQSQTTINSTKVILDESSQKCSQLNELVKQKDNVIKQQSQKLKLYEEKRIKFINQVHSIQNQISEIGFKNNQVEEQKIQLQAQLSKKQQQIELLSEKISLLLQNNSALQQQRGALNEQEGLLRKEIKQAHQRLRLANQNHQKTVNEIYEICESRKNEATNVLKEKIKELATQLTNCVNKLNNKNRDIEQNQQKFQKIQGLLQQNHQLLNQQRKQRQKLMAKNNQLLIQIDNYKVQLTSKDRESQSLHREKTIFREKLVEQQSKYEILRRKYQNLEHQKQNAHKEMENQNISLRILKEENKNIEKVMADQLNQRKGIIQQLMTQKKMLYAQLNQQR